MDDEPYQPDSPDWRTNADLRNARRKLMGRASWDERLAAGRLLAAELRMPMAIRVTEIPENLDDDMEVVEHGGNLTLLINPPETPER